jgi:hypothetical protein
MICQNAAEVGQNEVAYFQQLMANLKDSQVCCGPLTYIGLSQSAYSYFKAALVATGVDIFYLDSFIYDVIDSERHVILGMCPRHWFTHISVVGKHGIDMNNRIEQEISMFLFTFMCQNNNWDHKEVTNFLRMYSQARKSINE